MAKRERSLGTLGDLFGEGAALLRERVAQGEKWTAEQKKRDRRKAQERERAKARRQGRTIKYQKDSEDENGA